MAIEVELKETELEEIREKFEKKMSLEIIAQIINPSIDTNLYQRFVKEYHDIVYDYQNWWKKQIELHNLKDKDCYVDFINSTICSK